MSASAYSLSVAIPNAGFMVTRGEPVIGIETCTAEMLPWAKTPAVHTFKSFPAYEELSELIKEYPERT